MSDAKDYETKPEEMMLMIADMGTEIERLRAELLAVHNILTRWSDANKELEAEKAELVAALQRIGHETGETMRATNHGRRGDIANEIAAAAIAKAEKS